MFSGVYFKNSSQLLSFECGKIQKLSRVNAKKKIFGAPRDYQLIANIKRDD